METLIVALVAAFAILLGLIVYGTIVKNSWGINFRRVQCPNCGSERPLVRAPASVSEAVWGGGTCPKCGCRSDKWGRRITG